VGPAGPPPGFEKKPDLDAPQTREVDAEAAQWSEGSLRIQERPEIQEVVTECLRQTTGLTIAHTAASRRNIS